MDEDETQDSGGEAPAPEAQHPQVTHVHPVSRWVLGVVVLLFVAMGVSYLKLSFEAIRVDEQSSKTGALEANLASLDEEVATRTGTSGALKSEIQNLREDKATLESERAPLKASVQTLQQDETNLRDAARELEQTKVRLTQEISELTKAKADLPIKTAARDKANADLDRLEQQITTKQGILDGLDDKIDTAISEHSRVLAKVASSEGRAASAEKIAKTAQADLLTAQKQIAALSLETKQQEARSAQRQHRLWEGKVEARKSAVKSLSADITALKAEKKLVEDELEEKSSAPSGPTAAEIERRQKEEQELIVRIRTAKQKLAKRHTAEDSLDEEIARKERTKVKLEAATELLRLEKARYKEFEGTQEELEKSVAKKRKEKGKLKEEVTALETERKELKQKIKGLKKEAR